MGKQKKFAFCDAVEFETARKYPIWDFFPMIHSTDAISSQLLGLVNGYKGILVQRYVYYLDVPGPGSAGINGDRISGEKNPNETYP